MTRLTLAALAVLTAAAACSTPTRSAAVAAQPVAVPAPVPKPAPKPMKPPEPPPPSPYEVGMAALSRFMENPDCAGADLRVVVEKVAHLEGQVGNIDPSNPVWDPSTRVEIARIQAGSIERHTSLAFGLADAALESGCLDVADQAYRRIITYYTGSAYAGLRDRAKLGIDDVRAARTAGQ